MSCEFSGRFSKLYIKILIVVLKIDLDWADNGKQQANVLSAE